MRIFGTVLALLLAALLVVNTDWRAVLASLFAVSSLHLIGGLLLIQFQIIISALRWRFTAGRLGQTFTVRRAICEYYISTGLNQLLPGGIAGDAIRAYRARQVDGAGIARTGMSVAFERLSGQAALLVFVILSVILWPYRIYGYSKSIILTSCLCVVIATLILLTPLIRIRMPGLTAYLASAFWRSGAAIFQSVTSLMIVGSYIALFSLCAHATGSPLSLNATLMVVPVCLLTMVLPSGFGGWGTREAAAAALWPLAGFTSDQGIAASIVYGAIAMVGAAPGLVLFLWSNRT